MSNRLIVEVNLRHLEDVIKHKDNLDKYLKNHVGAKFRININPIKVEFNEKVYFIIEGVGQHRPWIEGSFKLYLNKHNINYSVLESKLNHTWEYGGFTFENGNLYSHTNNKHNVILRVLENLHSHMYLTNVKIKDLFNLTISKIFILGESNTVVKYHKNLKYYLTKPNSKGFDKELWQLLQVIGYKDRVKILAVVNNTLIDLLNLEYFNTKDLNNDKVEITKHQFESNLEACYLDEYDNLDYFDIKSKALLEQI